MIDTQTRVAEIVRMPRPTPTDVTTAGGVTTVNELPIPVNLNLYTGDDFSMMLTLTNPDNTPTDLTGASFLAEIRQSAPSKTVAATFAVATAANVITLSLTNEQTQSLVGKFVWDCQITSSTGIITTLAAGKVTFTQDVSRP
jgi:hypothetical protein